MDDVNIPRHTKGYQLEDFGEEVVLYDFETTQAVYLNDTASLIWRLCDGKWNIADIITLLQETYPSMSDQIQDDLRSTLGQFINCRAIELI